MYLTENMDKDWITDSSSKGLRGGEEESRTAKTTQSLKWKEQGPVDMGGAWWRGMTCSKLELP